MKNQRVELADVVRRFKAPYVARSYVARFGPQMMPSQKRALEDIAACMTSEMGGHQYRCLDCDHTFWIYHGCRNRACPACHGRRMRDWLQAREADSRRPSPRSLPACQERPGSASCLGSIQTAVARVPRSPGKGLTSECCPRAHIWGWVGGLV